MQLVLEYLFGAASFVPHGYCLLWRPDLVALHAVSDLITAAAYFSIPAALFVFLRKRRDLPQDYPMVAPAYAAQRSALAKRIGLGRKPAAAAPPAPEPAPAAAGRKRAA